MSVEFIEISMETMTELIASLVVADGMNPFGGREWVMYNRNWEKN